MKCNEIEHLMNDYVDGTLPEAAITAFEDHIAHCTACNTELTQLRTLMKRTEEISGGISPRRDLWPGIEGRIEEKDRKEERDSFRIPAYRSHIRSLVAAAATLLIIAGSLTIPRFLDKGMRSLMESELRWNIGMITTAAMEQHYQGISEGLFYSISKDLVALSETTLAIIDEHMQIIDNAIEDSRAAFMNDPSDAELQSMLSSAYQHKVALLQWTAQLITNI